MAAFLSLFSITMALAHYFIASTLIYLFSLNGYEKMSVACLIAALFLFLMGWFPLKKYFPIRTARYVTRFLYTWLGVLWFLFIVLAPARMLSWAFCLSFTETLLDQGEQSALRAFIGFAALMTAGLFVFVSYRNAHKPVLVKSVGIFLKNLPASFEGLRLVQLSDLHIGEKQDGLWLSQIVDRVNALKPDLIVITGDLVDGCVEQLAKDISPLAALKAPLGVYFVTGNHDYYSGADAWCELISNLGVRVLRNEGLTLKREESHEMIYLAGIEDHSSHVFPNGGPDIGKALAGRNKDMTAILLAHQPLSVFQAVRYGVDLQLSGHTHGGQIWPFGFLVRLQQPYTKGLYTHPHSNTQIYVSCGTGSWGPSMRLAAAEEITHITLSRA